ncbi:MAG: ATP-binding protein [Pedobacter sp.]|nr:MAG: ATP-binding protein [Pedobacter sp.]
MIHNGRNDKLIDLIINSEEWEEIECKRANIAPARLLESINAFSNTSGGVIVIGVEDKKKAQGKDRLFGISENPDNVSDIQNLARKNITPPISLTFDTYDVTNKDGKADMILVITVPKSNDIHSVGSDTYIRSGSHNNKIGSQEIIRLKYEKGSLKYEKEVSEVDDLEDTDPALIQQFIKDIGSESGDNWQCLKDNGLAVKIGDKYSLTRGGALVICKKSNYSTGK